MGGVKVEGALVAEERGAVMGAVELGGTAVVKAAEAKEMVKKEANRSQEVVAMVVMVEATAAEAVVMAEGTEATAMQVMGARLAQLAAEGNEQLHM